MDCLEKLVAPGFVIFEAAASMPGLGLLPGGFHHDGEGLGFDGTA
jgi:hypothetical protein